MIHLKVGEVAPLFTGVNQNGEPLSLENYKGKKVILYFYPQDDTPGCTTQACNLRDNFSGLKEKGYEIIGVSPDEKESHQKFISKYNLPFNLLADADKQVIEKYGVWGEKNLYGKKFMGLHRTTFIIDENGIIEKIIKRPKTKIHAEEILK